MIDFRKLIQAGVHFGHQKARWNPKMAPYIWGYSNNIHLINVAKSAHLLENAAQFLQKVASEGKTILLVGTKKPAQEIIKSSAQELGCPYVTHRWIGGTLTNFSQVKKSITKLLHCEDIVAKSAHDQSHYTKKELLQIQKMIHRLEENVGGIRNFSWPIGAIVIVDVRKEQAALKEAVSIGVPVVALVDTNSDPSLVDYVIPANDDAPRSISVIIEHLTQAIKVGMEQVTEKPAEELGFEDDGSSTEQLVEKMLAADEDAEGSKAKAKKTKEPVRPRSGGARRPDTRRSPK